MNTNQFKPLKKEYSQGFTLLELLISLSLSSVLLVVLVISFNQLSRIWENNNNQLDEKIDQSLIIMEIEKALSAAYPYTFKSEVSLKNKIFFVGENNKLQWISTVSPSYNDRIMIWSIALSDKGFKLLVTPVLSGDPSNKIQHALNNNKNSEMLLFTQYKVTPSYLFNEASGNQEWLDSWPTDERQSLPNAIRLNFSATDDDSELKSYDIISPIAANQTQLIRTR